MGITDINDDNGSYDSSVKNVKVSSSFDPAPVRRRGQPFIIVFLVILFVVSAACAGWLYIGNRALTRTKKFLVRQNYSAVARVDSMGQTAKSSEERMVTLEGKNAVLEDRKADFVSIEKSLNDRISKLESSNAKGESTVAALHSEIAVLNREVSGFRVKRAPFKKEIDLLVSENSSLAKQNEELADSVSVLTEQIAKANRVYRQRFIGLQDQNDKITSANISLIGEKAQLIGRYEDAASKKAVLLKENTQLANKNENLKIENASLSKGNADISGLNFDLLSENEEILAKNAILLSQKTELSEVMEMITAENIALSKKNSALVNEAAVAIRASTLSVGERSVPVHKVGAAVKRTAVSVKKKSGGWDKKSVAGMLASVKPESKGRVAASGSKVVVKEKTEGGR
ncbi:MAG: hypothetical protein FVQ79_05745 [Planctomycetes bacterium]|nr:hypothetical protein [Planctomycetota bacterium]